MNEDSFRFMLGAFRCTVIRDGSVTYPTRRVFANAPCRIVEQEVRARGLRPDGITLPYTCLLIDTGRQRVLVDTGAGPWTPGAGRLGRTLAALGLAPADIATVVLSHAHADHIGGATDAAGKPAFPHARYVLSRAEWDLWTTPAALADLEAWGFLVEPARAALPALRKRLELIDQDTEIAPGIRACGAPGHTPGHVILHVTSGGAHLLVSADTVIHPLHLEHPAWSWPYDLDHVQAARTARRLFNHAAAQQLPVLAAHVPFPGLGRVAQQGARWYWQPARGLDTGAAMARG